MTGDVYRTELEVDAPPERVFDHFVRPELMVRWMGDFARLEARDGGLFAVDINGVIIRGSFVRVERATGDDRIAIRFEGDGSLVCGASDLGAFDLDVASADRAREVLRAGGTVSVHRMRAVPFTARGLDAATLVFDHSVRARARVE